MNYVDTFVAAVPNENRDIYQHHAKEAARAFRALGALSVVACWGDDLVDGDVTSFPKSVRCEEGETVAVSWIVWPSKEVRNKAMARTGDDPRLNPAHNPMPFDGARMIFGSFEMIVEE
jgi:uncharacterized protein YbaA (DUF1428 family)